MEWIGWMIAGIFAVTAVIAAAYLWKQWSKTKKVAAPVPSSDPRAKRIEELKGQVETANRDLEADAEEVILLAQLERVRAMKDNLAKKRKAANLESKSPVGRAEEELQKLKEERAKEEPTETPAPELTLEPEARTASAPATPTSGGTPPPSSTS